MLLIKGFFATTELMSVCHWCTLVAHLLSDTEAWSWLTNQWWVYISDSTFSAFLALPTLLPSVSHLLSPLVPFFLLLHFLTVFPPFLPYTKSQGLVFPSLFLPFPCVILLFSCSVFSVFPSPLQNFCHHLYFLLSFDCNMKNVSTFISIIFLIGYLQSWKWMSRLSMWFS